MTKIYVVTVISSCDNAYEGDPIALDEQFLYTKKTEAKTKLKELYKERKSYVKYCDGEIAESYCEDDEFRVELLEEGKCITYYSGIIKEYAL